MLKIGNLTTCWCWCWCWCWCCWGRRWRWRWCRVWQSDWEVKQRRTWSDTPRHQRTVWPSCGIQTFKPIVDQWLWGCSNLTKKETTKDVYLYFFLPQWLEVMGRVFDIEGLCQQMFLFSNKINLSIFWWFAHFVLRLVWGLSRIIHYRINTAAVNVRKANIQILRVKGILAQSFFAFRKMIKHC